MTKYFNPDEAAERREEEKRREARNDDLWGAFGCFVAFLFYAIMICGCYC